MKKSVIVIILVAVAAIAGGMYFVTSQRSGEDVQTTSDHQGSDMKTTQSRNTEMQQTYEPVSVNKVDIKDFDFQPQTITVKKGTTVTWTNQDVAKHDINPDSESDNFKASELLAKGESYSWTFNTAGTYTYHCSPHPYMKATVIVTE